MKKITLLFLAFIAFNFSNAQDTCATASVVAAGTTTVAAVDGTEVPDPICAANGAGAAAGEWYIYTATIDGVATVNTDLPANAGGDTRVHIYSGDCGSLTCVGGNDDTATNYLSTASFAVSTGTSYYIAFDDRWDAGGFDFELTEEPYECPNTFPYSDDMQDTTRYQVCYSVEDVNDNGNTWTYNTVNDLDGDGTNDNIANVFPPANPAPLVAKDDWLFTTALNGTAGNTYDITVVYNGVDVRGTASEALDIVALDAPSSAAGMQSILGSFTDITQQGVFGDTNGNDLITQAYSSTVSYTPAMNGDFYIGIHAVTALPDSDVLMVMSIAVEETLSINEFEANVFSHSYNKDTKELSLESSNLPLTGIEVYNILGQRVLNQGLNTAQAQINLASLTDGVYLAKIKVDGASKTIKFIKQ